MRVTHVITRLIVGGAQENTIASVLGLRQKPDLEVDLVSGPTQGPEGSLEPLLVAAGCSPIIVPHLVRPVSPWKDLLALRELERLFRERSPDIVHTHSGKAGILGRLAAARAGTTTIIHTIHGPSFGSFQGPLSNWIFRAAERYAARVTHHFVVVADAMKEQYLAARIGKRPLYTTIRSGFPLKPFRTATNDPNLRAKLGIGPDDIVVGKIARLVPLKGYDDLFKTAPALVRSCPKIRFLLVGDGEWRLRYERLAESLGVRDHFIFAGLVPPEDVARLMGIMDIVVHLSAREGLPRALSQALAAARPVVAYDCDGAREVCLENETGFLLQRGDLGGLRQRLLELAHNPALRQRLGQNGQRFVQTRFDVQHMVDALHDLYVQLAGTGGRQA
jgi:glycosyltransferase involved in cell wall biosynthesis